MRTRRRFLALLLVLLIPLAGILAPLSRAETVWFSVVNNQVLTLSARTMPIYTAKEILIPHEVLTSTSLGVTATWTPSQRYFTLTKDTKSITFELGSNIAFDTSGQYNQRCARISDSTGDIFLLPLNFICDYFGFTAQEPVTTAYGTMVRIIYGKALPQDSFLTLFDQVIADKVNAWTGAVPSPSASRPPSVSPGTSMTPPASASPSPRASPLPEPKTVFLTFEGGPTPYTNAILDVLDTRGLQAGFFLRGGEIAGFPAVVRRIAATQTVGLSSYDADPGGFFASDDEMLAQLALGNEQLDAAAVTKTFLVRLPGGSAGHEALCRTLVSAGYRYWDWTVDASSETFTTARQLTSYVLSRLASAPPGPAVLKLGQDEMTGAGLDGLLSELVSGNFVVLPLDPTGRPINFADDLCIP